jgi:chromate reductase
MEVISPQVSVPNGARPSPRTAFREERLRKGMTRLCRTLIEHAGLFDEDEP